MGKIRFGVYLPFYAFKAEERRLISPFDRVRDVVLECERLGYHSVWLDDHLMFGNGPILECWTTLSALSSVTARIRLGTMVSCASFRNPSLLAKMAATLDVISGGRLEFGIGAGAQRDEHVAYGMPFPESSVRIGRMKEAVEIIKKMWTEEKASYEGEYYRINEAVCEPKPLQKPHPPMTIGGGGERLTLKVSARHADRSDWGYLPSFELYKHKLEVLRRHCSAVGRNFQEIEKSCWLGDQILIKSSQKEIDEKLLQRKPKNLSSKDPAKRDIVDTAEDCIQKIQQYANAGVTYFMLFFGDLPKVNSLRLFHETVVKQMKSTA